MREDLLARYRKRTGHLQRALQILLTERRIVENYGYQDQLLAEAIKWLMRPNLHHREPGDVALQAWPGLGNQQPVITFDVPATAMEKLYAKHDGNRAYIRMGEIGGTLIADLDPDIVARRFMPELALRIITFTENCKMSDTSVLECIDVPLNQWLIGLN
ncbi:hypothetical protein [Marinibacterium profundimaris]|uniref:hypothetical protein n=1 Tax=Marinibacterium profundimaris TaxID=1679460 RepID=UPI00117E8E07|nr:hypothetical protein [Marinibacterium profundimaris]